VVVGLRQKAQVPNGKESRQSSKTARLEMLAILQVSILRLFPFNEKKCRPG